MMPPQLLAGLGAGALILGFLGGWTVRDWKADSDDLGAIQQADKKRDELTKRANDKADQLETFLAGQAGQQITDRNTIREIYRDVKVPSDCAAPAAAASLLEAARNRANAAASGKLEAPLPAVTASADARP